MNRFPLILAATLISAPAFATSPTSGEITETSGSQTFTGGPYFLPTPGGILAGSGVECEIPETCDEYALTVTIADEFRDDEANKKEVVQIVMTPTVLEPNVGGAADIDLYLLDASGNEVGSSTSPTATEVIRVPLTVLKNGGYTVRLITGIPLGTSESVEIRVGRGKSLPKGLSVTPAVADVGETVRFDARDLAPAGDTAAYSFDFGDGMVAQNFTGLVEHTYARPGAYLAKVSVGDSQRRVYGASQTIAVTGVVAAKSGSGLLAGSFGFASLLGLFALAGVRRRRA